MPLPTSGVPIWLVLVHLCCCSGGLLTSSPAVTAVLHLTVVSVAFDCAQAAKLRRTVHEADKQKLSRRIQHSAPGSITVKPERKKKIIAELE